MSSPVDFFFIKNKIIITAFITKNCNLNQEMIFLAITGEKKSLEYQKKSYLKKKG